MKKAIYFMVILSLIASLSIRDANARKVILSPAKTSTLTSPIDTRDTRLLLLFSLPGEVTNT